MRFRGEQGAKNEIVFREVNERIGEIERSIRTGDEGIFLCECGKQDCRRPVDMTVAEYEEVRAHPSRFFVVPGHEDPNVEFVVTSNERYAVVEKFGEAGELASENDPRAR